MMHPQGAAGRTGGLAIASMVLGYIGVGFLALAIAVAATTSA